MLSAQLFGKRKGSLMNVSMLQETKSLQNHLLHSDRCNINMTIGTASQKHVCTRHFDKFPQSLTDNVDDGVISEKVLAKRTSETNRSVVQNTKTSNARY